MRQITRTGGAPIRLARPRSQRVGRHLGLKRMLARHEIFNGGDEGLDRLQRMLL